MALIFVSKCGILSMNILYGHAEWSDLLESGAVNRNVLPLIFVDGDGVAIQNGVRACREWSSKSKRFATDFCRQ